MRNAPARGWAVLSLIGIATALTGINLSVMYVVYPEIQQAFPEASSAQTSWVLNGFTLIMAATLIIGGVLGDRYGRKRSLIVGLACLGLGSTLCATAPGVGLIVIGRLVIGLGASLISTSSVAIVLREFPPEHRAAAFGVLGSFGGVAAAAGPSIGSMVLELGGWRWAFWINVPLALVSLVLGVLLLSESRNPDANDFVDALSALLMLVSVGLIVLAVVQLPAWGIEDLRTVACVAVAATSAAYLCVRMAGQAAPLVDLALVRERNSAIFNAIAFVMGVGWFGMYLAVVLFLRDTWDYTLLHAGLAITPVFIGAAVLGPLGGRVADRFGFRPNLMAGGLALAVGALWLIVRLQNEPDTSVWFIGIVPIAIGTGLVFPSFQAGAIIASSPEQYGTAAGVNQTLQRVGAAIGTAITVALVEVAGTEQALDHVLWVIVAAAAVTTAAAAGLAHGGSTRKVGTVTARPRRQETLGRIRGDGRRTATCSRAPTEARREQKS